MAHGIDITRSQADFLARIVFAGGRLAWSETKGVTDNTITSCYRRGWVQTRDEQGRPRASISITAAGARLLGATVNGPDGPQEDALAD